MDQNQNFVTIFEIWTNITNIWSPSHRFQNKVSMDPACDGIACATKIKFPNDKLNGMYHYGYILSWNPACNGDACAPKNKCTNDIL